MTAFVLFGLRHSTTACAIPYHITLQLDGRVPESLLRAYFPTDNSLYRSSLWLMQQLERTLGPNQFDTRRGAIGFRRESLCVEGWVMNTSILDLIDSLLKSIATSDVYHYIDVARNAFGRGQSSYARERQGLPPNTVVLSVIPDATLANRTDATFMFRGVYPTHYRNPVDEYDTNTISVAGYRESNRLLTASEARVYRLTQQLEAANATVRRFVEETKNNVSPEISNYLLRQAESYMTKLPEGKADEPFVEYKQLRSIDKKNIDKRVTYSAAFIGARMNRFGQIMEWERKLSGIHDDAILLKRIEERYTALMNWYTDRIQRLVQAGIHPPDAILNLILDSANGTTVRTRLVDLTNPQPIVQLGTLAELAVQLLPVLDRIMRAPAHPPAPLLPEDKRPFQSLQLQYNELKAKDQDRKDTETALKTSELVARAIEQLTAVPNDLFTPLIDALNRFDVSVTATDQLTNVQSQIRFLLLKLKDRLVATHTMASHLVSAYPSAPAASGIRRITVQTLSTNLNRISVEMKTVLASREENWSQDDERKTIAELKSNLNENRRQVEMKVQQTSQRELLRLQNTNNELKRQNTVLTQAQRNNPQAEQYAAMSGFIDDLMSCMLAVSEINERMFQVLLSPGVRFNVDGGSLNDYITPLEYITTMQVWIATLPMEEVKTMTDAVRNEYNAAVRQYETDRKAWQADRLDPSADAKRPEPVLDPRVQERWNNAFITLRVPLSVVTMRRQIRERLQAAPDDDFAVFDVYARNDGPISRWRQLQNTLGAQRALRWVSQAAYERVGEPDAKVATKFREGLKAIRDRVEAKLETKSANTTCEKLLQTERKEHTELKKRHETLMNWCNYVRYGWNRARVFFEGIQTARQSSAQFYRDNVEDLLRQLSVAPLRTPDDVAAAAVVLGRIAAAQTPFALELDAYSQAIQRGELAMRTLQTETDYKETPKFAELRNKIAVVEQKVRLDATRLNTDLKDLKTKYVQLQAEMVKLYNFNEFSQTVLRSVRDRKDNDAEPDWFENVRRYANMDIVRRTLVDRKTELDLERTDANYRELKTTFESSVRRLEDRARADLEQLRRGRTDHKEMERVTKKLRTAQVVLSRLTQILFTYEQLAVPYTRSVVTDVETVRQTFARTNIGLGDDDKNVQDLLEWSRQPITTNALNREWSTIKDIYVKTMMTTLTKETELDTDYADVLTQQWQANSKFVENIRVELQKFQTRYGKQSDQTKSNLIALAQELQRDYIAHRLQECYSESAMRALRVKVSNIINTHCVEWDAIIDGKRHAITNNLPYSDYKDESMNGPNVLDTKYDLNGFGFGTAETKSPPPPPPPSKSPPPPPERPALPKISDSGTLIGFTGGYREQAPEKQRILDALLQRTIDQIVDAFQPNGRVADAQTEGNVYLNLQNLVRQYGGELDTYTLKDSDFETISSLVKQTKRAKEDAKTFADCCRRDDASQKQLREIRQEFVTSLATLPDNDAIRVRFNSTSPMDAASIKEFFRSLRLQRPLGGGSGGGGAMVGGRQWIPDTEDEPYSVFIRFFRLVAGGATTGLENFIESDTVYVSPKKPRFRYRSPDDLTSRLEGKQEEVDDVIDTSKETVEAFRQQFNEAIIANMKAFDDQCASILTPAGYQALLRATTLLHHVAIYKGAPMISLVASRVIRLNFAELVKCEYRSNININGGGGRFQSNTISRTDTTHEQKKSLLQFMITNIKRIESVPKTWNTELWKDVSL